MVVRTPYLVILLILFLCAFLWLKPLVVFINEGSADLQVFGVSVFGVGFQVFFALAIVFLEFLIFFFSMLDKIGDTIKAVLKPLLSLVPLALFVSSVQDVFAPIFLTVLPHPVVVQFAGARIAAEAGVAQNQSYIAQAVQNGSFAESVWKSVAFMLLFAVISRTFTAPRDFSAELRRLREENARLRKLFQ